MTHKEMGNALKGYFAAVGIDERRSAFCIPFLTGEQPIPSVELESTQKAETRVVKLITFAEAGRLLGCSRHTIWRMTKDGTLNVVNWRGKNKVRLVDVLAVGECGMADKSDGEIGGTGK